MKFEINSGCLTAVIKALVNGCRSTDILWLNADNSGIEIRLPKREELGVSVRINNTEHTDLEYICHESGFATIRAADLNSILQQCAASRSVLICHPAETDTVSVLNHGIEVMLRVEYCNPVLPLVALDEPEQIFTVERDIFINTMSVVRFAMCHNTTWPKFCGIHVESSRGKIQCVAGTCGFFAIKEAISKLLQSNKQINIFFPGTSIGCIVAAFSALSSPTLECKLYCEGTICLLTSGFLEIRIEDIPNEGFPHFNMGLINGCSNKLCIRMSDLRPITKRIQAAINNAYKHGDNRLSFVDVAVDTNAGNMLLSWGATARGKIPLTLNTVVSSIESVFEFSSGIDVLNLICKSWRTSGEITIFYNADKPLFIKLSDEAVRENDPDVVICSAITKKIPTASQEEQK